MYDYDPAGWLVKRTWARGVSATYAHNRLGELTGITYSDGTTPNVTLARDGEGRVAAIGDGTGGWSYGYDDAGRLEREARAATGDALIYQRDEAGRRTGYGFYASFPHCGSLGTHGVAGQLRCAAGRAAGLRLARCVLAAAVSGP